MTDTLALTIPQAAELMGISRSQLDRLIARGEFPVPVHNFGRRCRRIYRASLERYLADPAREVVAS